MRSISNNSTRANLSRIKRGSYGDASPNRKLFDRNSKQKTSTSLAILSNTLFRKQGISRSNGCVGSAAMKGGSLNAPLAGIGLLYHGMHVFDVAALLGLRSSSFCPISIVRSCVIVRSCALHGLLSHRCAIVRFWPLLCCCCTILLSSTIQQALPSCSILK